jgi:hypothetical protein
VNTTAFVTKISPVATVPLEGIPIMMTTSNLTPPAVPQPGADDRKAPWWAGRWYFVVAVVSVGLFAWVPFVHAATRLHRRSVSLRAALFGAGALAYSVLLAFTPTTDQGRITGSAGQAFSVIGTLLLLAMVAVACIQLAPLRREVYRRRPVVYADPPVALPGTDPAVAAVMASRARREEARQFVTRDPLIARDLRIGRPDLPRTYDDGGLVDLNSAPAAVIAELCDLAPAVAESIVTARVACGGFLAVDDVFATAEIPVGSWDMIRDRGVAIPR